jgi:hypothetical protein
MYIFIESQAAEILRLMLEYKFMQICKRMSDQNVAKRVFKKFVRTPFWEVDSIIFVLSYCQKLNAEFVFN